MGFYFGCILCQFFELGFQKCQISAKKISISNNLIDKIIAKKKLLEEAHKRNLTLKDY